MSINKLIDSQVIDCLFLNFNGDEIKANLENIHNNRIKEILLGLRGISIDNKIEHLFDKLNYLFENDKSVFTNHYLYHPTFTYWSWRANSVKSMTKINRNLQKSLIYSILIELFIFICYKNGHNHIPKDEDDYILLPVDRNGGYVPLGQDFAVTIGPPSSYIGRCYYSKINNVRSLFQSHRLYSFEKMSHEFNNTIIVKIPIINKGPIYDDAYRVIQLDFLNKNILDTSSIIKTLEESYDLLSRCWINASTIIGKTLKWIQILPPLKESIQDFTSERYLSCISTTFCRGLDLAEVLVHEYSHNILTILEWQYPLFDIQQNRVYFASPWRDEPRPIRPLLHGIHAFSNVANLHSMICKNEKIDYDIRKKATEKFLYRKNQVIKALDEIEGDQSSLTSIGKRFLRNVSIQFQEKGVSQ